MQRISKLLKTLSVNLVGKTIAIEDRSEKAMYASQALSEVLAHRDIINGYTTEGETVTIPYSAIEYISVLTHNNEYSKPDAVCEEE